MRSFEEPLIVCDLGCGDFNIGKELATCARKYVGVDIVPALIEHNKSVFEHANIEFHCLDIAKDRIPPGDCAILRFVLQHLSNAEVQRILYKLKGFKYVILTEHIPIGVFEPNKDIISGQGIRLKKQSGLDILAPPFNFKVKEEKQLLSVIIDDFEGVMVTTLYTLDEYNI